MPCPAAKLRIATSKVQSRSLRRPAGPPGRTSTGSAPGAAARPSRAGGSAADGSSADPWAKAGSAARRAASRASRPARSGGRARFSFTSAGYYGRPGAPVRSRRSHAPRRRRRAPGPLGRRLRLLARGGQALVELALLGRERLRHRDAHLGEEVAAAAAALRPALAAQAQDAAGGAAGRDRQLALAVE